MGTPNQSPIQGIGGFGAGAPPAGSSNITVVNPPGGTTNFIPKWTGPASLGDSAVSEVAGLVTLTKAAIGAAFSVGLLLANSTAATAVVQQWSPSIQLAGSVWETTTPGPVAVKFNAQLETTQGTSVTRSALTRFGFTFAGGAQVDVLKLTSGGYILAGSATLVAAATVRIGLGNNEFIGCEYSGTSYPMLGITGAGVGNVGDNTGVRALQLFGSTVVARSNGTFVVQSTGTGLNSIDVSSTRLVVGTGDATATTADYALRGAARTGTDAAASTLTIQGFNGTGAGASGQILYQIGVVTGTSPTAHVMASRFAIGGGSSTAGTGVGGVLVGSYAISTIGDQGNGTLSVAASAGGGSIYIGSAVTGVGQLRLQQSGNTSFIGAYVSAANTYMQFLTNTTTGGTVDRFQFWATFAGNISAGNLVSFGDGASYTPRVAFSQNTAVWGADASATPGSYTHRAGNSRGGTDVDVVGGSLTYASGLGTGAAVATSHTFTTPTPVGTGSTQQAAANRMRIGGGAVGAGGVSIGAYAVNTLGDPGDGILVVAGASLTGSIGVGGASGAGRLQQVGNVTVVGALSGAANAFLDLQAFTTIAATVDRVRAWSFAGTATAGTIFAVGDGGSFTRKWAVSFGGDVKLLYSASAVGGNIATTTPTGKVRILAGGTSVTITNALCVSLALNNVRVAVVGVDNTAKTAVAVAGTGSFVITLNAATTADVDVFYEIVSQA